MFTLAEITQNTQDTENKDAIDQPADSAGHISELLTSTRPFIAEMRRIIFRLIGLDNLVIFFNTCCNYYVLNGTDELLTRMSIAEFAMSDAFNHIPDEPLLRAVIEFSELPEHMQEILTHAQIPFNILFGRMRHIRSVAVANEMAFNKARSEAQWAKRKAFTAVNIRQLLWFAIECGLDLSPNATHNITFEPNDALMLYNLYGVGSEDQTLATTAQLLTKLRLLGEAIPKDVANAVIRHVDFDGCTPIRSNMEDSGSEAWYHVLDSIFVQHQAAHPELDPIDILVDHCLIEYICDLTKLKILIHVDKFDPQRRMLPYLLSKPNLSDSGIIRYFIRNANDDEYIIACAKLCVPHKDWIRTHVLLIDIYAYYPNLLVCINALPEGNFESVTAIATYVSANMQLDYVNLLREPLMRLVAARSMFETDLSVDCMLAWLKNVKKFDSISQLACMFAHQIFLTRSAGERAVIYDRYLEAWPDFNLYCELVYHLLHGEESVGNCERSLHCSIRLVRGMCNCSFTDQAIAHVIDVMHARERVEVSNAVTIQLFISVCELGLQFDLLMRLAEYHLQSRMSRDVAEAFMEQIKETSYSDDQYQALFECFLHSDE
ncbi:hypothetical protein JKY72_06015 [Candidatus Gracilibacteria bacterium]|nr:hypothetical protein [Candidatus Gracilibacteria bacterium]